MSRCIMQDTCDFVVRRLRNGLYPSYILDGLVGELSRIAGDTDNQLHPRLLEGPQGIVIAEVDPAGSNGPISQVRLRVSFSSMRYSAMA